MAERPAIRRRPISLVVTTGLFGVVLLVTGCERSTKLDTRYGMSQGLAGKGIQGTGLVADLFRDAGFTVSTARTLGRSVERAQTVFWAPNSFHPPNDATCDFFEAWLSADSSRTLVYVGRDYSAEVEYWNRLVEEDGRNAMPLRQRRAAALVEWDTVRAALPSDEKCRWFQLERHPIERRVTTLTGPWAKDVVAGKVRPMVGGQLIPSAKVSDGRWQALLSANDDPLVARYARPHWRNNRLILVANGSLLLNLPMIEPAYRGLARRLINECAAGRVVFLTSGQTDPPIATGAGTHHLLRVFTTAPLRCILMHLSALGILYCLSVFPCFGQPRSLQPTDASDFGRHVAALGRLLARTRDEGFANAARTDYLGDEGGNPFRTKPKASNI